MSGTDLRTVNEVFARATGRGKHPLFLKHDSAGGLQPISSGEAYGMVRALAEVLQAWGVAKGDRVAILSENRWEWAISDYAVLTIGGVDVPLYATNTPEQVGYMLRDSGSKVAIVSNGEQLAKLKTAGDLPSLERVIVIEGGEEGTAESWSKLLAGAKAKEARDAAFDAGGERGAAGRSLHDHLYLGNDG